MRTTAKTADGDMVTAHELALYTVNDGALYREQTQPIIEALARRLRRGDYDHEKALRLWGYLVESAAKAYTMEFCDLATKWYVIFPPPVRKLVAEELAEHYAEAIAELGLPPQE